MSNESKCAKPSGRVHSKVAGACRSVGACQRTSVVSPSACPAFAAPGSNVASEGSAGGVSWEGTGFSVRNNPFHHISGDLIESCWPQAFGTERAPIASDAKAVKTDREGTSKKDMSPKVFARGFGQNAAQNKLCEFCSKTEAFRETRFTHARGTILNARCS